MATPPLEHPTPTITAAQPGVESKFQFQTPTTTLPTVQQVPVSSGNPCPFLRGLVAQRLLPDDQATGQQIVDAVQHIERLQDIGGKPVPAFGLKAVAAIGNGLSPLQVARNMRHGVHLDQLRYGPLYKNGVHSGILNEQGEIDQAALARVQQFASLKTTADGRQELGLNQKEIQVMLDAFYDSADPHVRKARYRKMMDAEWPVLLEVIGTQGKNERYLSVVDITRLFVQGEFPQHIQSRLQQGR